MFFSPRAFNASFPASTTQAKNRATGAAMSLLNKNGTRNLPSARRDKSQHSFRPEGQADKNNSLGIEPDGAGAKRLTFAEDFMMEHSHSGRSIASIGIAVGYATAPKEPQPPDQSFGFPF
jgi:hypothetical protein